MNGGVVVKQEGVEGMEGLRGPKRRLEEGDPLNLEDNQCIFCQRRTIVTPVPRGKRRKLSPDEPPWDIEPVPEVDLTEITSEGMASLLETLNWMWGAPGRQGCDTNLWDKCRSKNKFGKVGKMCGDCGEKVLEVDRFLGEVRKQMGLLRRLILWGRLRLRRQAQVERDPLSVSPVPGTSTCTSSIKSEPETDEEDFNSDDSVNNDEDPDYLNSEEDSDNLEEDSEEEEDMPTGTQLQDEPEESSSSPKNEQKKSPLKIKIPPGYTSTVKRDDSGKPMYLIVTNPINNRDYWICVMDSCGETFMGADNQERFERHKNEKHKEKFAEVTRVKWSVAKELADELPWKRAENGNICKLCGDKFAKSSLKKHLKAQHNVIVEGALWGNKNFAVYTQPCDLCQMELPLKQLVEHLKTHVGEEYILRCPNSECLFACIKQTRLEIHLTKSVCRSKSIGDFKEYQKSVRTCPECGIYCGNTLLGLRGHLLSEHETAEKKFPCPVSGCGMRFSVRQSVVLHLGHHDVPKRVESQPCLECDDKKKIKIEEMEDHLKEVHGVEQGVKCRKCPFLFPSWEKLVNHMFQHRFGELLCDICEESGGRFNRHSNLAEHYFIKHKIGKQFQCEHCPKTFLRLSSLQNHVKKDHEKVDNPKVRKTFECQECGVVLKSKPGLKTHKIREHGDQNFFRCQFCNDPFTNVVALRNHELVVHKGVVRSEEFPCEEPNCGRIFKSKGKLKEHHKFDHLGEKGKHICDICGKDFKNSTGLKTHMGGVHLDLRKFTCEICGDCFTSISVLKRHKLIHTGERPYFCHICDQRFRHKEVLKRHLEGHQEKGADFKPNGPMKEIRKRVEMKRKTALT